MGSLFAVLRWLFPPELDWLLAVLAIFALWAILGALLPGPTP